MIDDLCITRKSTNRRRCASSSCVTVNPVTPATQAIAIANARNTFYSLYSPPLTKTKIRPRFVEHIFRTALQAD